MSLEFNAVRDPFLKYLKDIGWEYLKPEECLDLRAHNLSQPFLVPILREKIKLLNKNIIDSDAQVEEVVKKLKTVRANIVGNQDFLEFLRGEKTLYIEKEKRELNIKLIDFDNFENNSFHITKEYEFSDYKVDRPDIIPFINGIPLVPIEMKSPRLENAMIEAFSQIKRYHEEIPELMKVTQLYALSDSIQLRYAPTWNLSQRNVHSWKLQDGKTDLERMVKEFFDRQRILSIIENYTFFFTMEKEIYKFVLDQHQMRAAEKVVRRILVERIDSGLIWHTQGSGKTLTMIVAAHMLRNAAKLEKPTILVVVDRIELEGHWSENLESFGFPDCRIANTREELHTLLQTDFRGLIVTTIQKFDRMEKTVNTRKNIILLIDEAHRSQEGDLAIHMHSALPNAFYFGFTGTPIDKSNIGKGTFSTFGKHDPAGYLDKYSIKESIKDGTTVPLYYTLAPQELRVEKQLLEDEFYKLIEGQGGVASIEELDKILQKSVKLKNFLKADKRVDGVAKYVAQHFKEYIEPLGLKAFVVTIDREGCALYKEALDKYLPKDYSEVVFTGDQKDSDLLRQFHLREDEETNIRSRFKSQAELPNILIVTQKLLTGFDAPILYCMYLDKPLKDHTLLQAIARVNRPLSDPRGENKKTGGLIVDFVGVLENIKRALAFDSTTIEGALTDLRVLKDRFSDLIKEAEKEYFPLLQGGQINDKTVTVIEERFLDIKIRQKFFKQYRQIEDLFEILSPDVFLRDYLTQYSLLTTLYRLVRNVFASKEIDIYADIEEKTKGLIRKNVSLDNIVKNVPVYKIDDKIVERLAADRVEPSKANVVDLWRSIVIHSEREAKQEPHLYSLSDKAEEILRKFEEGQIESRVALDELIDITRKIATSEKERAQYKLEKGEFSVFWYLRDNSLPSSADTIQSSKLIFKILEGARNWPLNKKKEMELRKEVYKVLISKVDVDKLPTLVDYIFEMHRRMME